MEKHTNVKSFCDLSFRLYQPLCLIPQKINVLVFLQLTGLVISGGLDCQLVIWDTKTRKSLKVYNMSEVLAAVQKSNQVVNPPFIFSLALNPINPKQLAIGLGDYSVQILDIEEETILFSMDDHKATVSQVY